MAQLAGCDGMVRKAEPKPRKSRLKVSQTAIGFHGAYVAAPSRKAALAAWVTGKDLFARCVAQEVIDRALTEEPLSAPGTVFRQMRAVPHEESDANLLKATKRNARTTAVAKHAMQPVPPSPPPPQPSDQEVEDAQQAFAATRKQQEREMR